MMLIFFITTTSTNNILREFACYERHPGDERVRSRVRTEVRVVAKIRQLSPTFGVAEIGVDLRKFCARGLSKIGPVIGELTPKKIPSDRWDSALK